ncbi:MAG TPA: DEAD/DEAH box helicase [Candidatus Dormibacteraeota bacterium]|nr:DEAD/DEAH box helicase [Candidatus Dormibacteraeota bacterium]
MSYNQNRRAYSSGRRQSIHQPRSTTRRPKKEFIHPSRFIQSATSTQKEDYSPRNAFSDFAIHSLLQDNLIAKGYTIPSPIQDQTIPLGLSGRDVVGIANTGTGKTAAFAIPLLNRLITNHQDRALILAPTRELAQQIEDQCREIAKGTGLRGALLIGGVSIGPQYRELKLNPQIVIGTPGRIKDHSEQRTLNLASFNIIVLDEVDRMLDMGFINDISHILGKTAPKRQSYFFSATLDSKVTTIIQGFASDPTHVVVKTGDTADNVDQNVVSYNGKDEKIAKLHDLLLQKAVVKTLVFDDTHRSVERLSKELQTRGFDSDAIHGGKSQSQRQRALQRFRDNQVKILVATDVAARGIDVSDITHVVNYSEPQSYGDYVHRIGRAGRAGRPGYALTFVEQQGY